MITSNLSVTNSDSGKPIFLQSAESPSRSDVLVDKIGINSAVECLQTRGNGQKILKSIHPVRDRVVTSTNLEVNQCFVPVTDAEFDNLQSKYGELSGEIIIVEITLRDIYDILASNSRAQPASQSPTTPRNYPTVPVSALQKPSNCMNPRFLKSLGISLCGNKDLNQMTVLVCGLRPGSIAEADGRIAVGDQLLELNEHVLYGRSHLNAGPLIRSCLLNVLHRGSSKRSKSPASLCFVICRNPENLANMAVTPLSYVSGSQKVSPRNSVNAAPGPQSPSRGSTQARDSLVGRSTFEEIHATRLLRGRNGFGFAIMDKSFTNEPGIYIKQLVENGPAALDGTLRAGDRILRVDWHDALHANYDSVLEWLRSARHQVRVVVSRVRLCTGENRPSEDEDQYKMRFRKRLSAPLISSLIHAFMHPSSSISSKKTPLHFASMDGPMGSAQGTEDQGSPDHKASNEVRRASCPDAVVPGFAKRLAARSFLGIVPMASLTQLAGPPIPVLPLAAVEGGDGGGGSGGTRGVALRERYEAALERFASSYRKRRNRENGPGPDDAGAAATRPVLPGQKTLVHIRKNTSPSLGISLIGGCETSLGVLQIHEIFPEGAVALDGRLQPGDRVLAVNNEPLSNLPYSVAVATIAAAFSGQKPLASQADLSSLTAVNLLTRRGEESEYIALVVERPGPGVQTKWYDQEVTVDLVKKPGRGLGLCIVERSGPALVATNGLSTATVSPVPSPHPPMASSTPTSALPTNRQLQMQTDHSGLGVIVCDLIKGSTAYMDGRIMIGDQILAINDVDVENSSQEEVAMLLKTAQGAVSLRLGRLKNQPIPLNSVAAAFIAEP